MDNKIISFVFGALNAGFAITSFSNGSYFWGILCAVLAVYSFKQFANNS